MFTEEIKLVSIRSFLRQMTQ